MMTEEKYNFVKMYERSFRENWDAEALTDYGTDVTLTYGQLAINIEKLHILFKECGIKKNDKIAVMGKNNSNWIAVYLATVTYGAIIVPILQDFPANDAIHIINHSESKLLFISDINWEGIDLDQIPKALAAISLNDWHPISMALDPKKINYEAIARKFKEKHPDGYGAKDVHFDERPNSEIGSINYTSGTTGFSKGVVMPLNGLAGNVRYGLESGIAFKGARFVTFLPLAHAYGCAFDFLACLAAGGHSWLIGRTPSPKILLKAFEEVKPTVILSVPLILEKIYKKMIVPQIQKPPVSWVLKVPFLDEVVCSKIREQLVQAFGGEFSQMIIGGAPLNPEVEAFLHRIKFPVSVGYGMTECAPLLHPDQRGTEDVLLRQTACRNHGGEDPQPQQRGNRRGGSTRREHHGGILQEPPGNQRGLHQGRMAPYRRPGYAGQRRIPLYQRTLQDHAARTFRTEYIPGGDRGED